MPGYLPANTITNREKPISVSMLRKVTFNETVSLTSSYNLTLYSPDHRTTARNRCNSRITSGHDRVDLCIGVKFMQVLPHL